VKFLFSIRRLQQIFILQRQGQKVLKHFNNKVKYYLLSWTKTRIFLRKSFAFQMQNFKLSPYTFRNAEQARADKL